MSMQSTSPSNGRSGAPSRSSAFLSVLLMPQSYVNIGYLLLALPLGAAYSILLTAGLALGLGLTVVWVGIPVLALVLAASLALGHVERGLTVGLLRCDIPLQRREKSRAVAEDGPRLSAGELRIVGAWRRAKRHLSDPLTWSRMFYLMLKLPLGIVSFIVAVTLLAVTMALISAPALHVGWPDGVPSLSVNLSWAEELLRMGAGDLAWVEEVLAFNGFGADALWESVVFAVAGLPMALATLHLLNGVAFLWARWARLMLGSTGASAATEGKREPAVAHKGAPQPDGGQTQEPEHAARGSDNEERAAA